MNLFLSSLSSKLLLLVYDLKKNDSKNHQPYQTLKRLHVLPETNRQMTENKRSYD